MIGNESISNVALVGMQMKSVPPHVVPCKTCDYEQTLLLYPTPGKMLISSFISTKSHHFQIIERKNKQQFTESLSGIFVILLFALLVLAKVSYPRRFQQFLLASLSNNGLNLLLREWSPARNILTYLFVFVYLSGLTLLISITADYFGGGIHITGHPLQDLLILFLITVIIVTGKYQTITWLSSVFNVRNSGIRYLSNHIIFSLITSLALIPILLSIIYNPSDITLLLAYLILLLIQVFRLIRSFVVGMSERGIHLFYLFVYLCTLEILPVLLLLKALTIVSSGNTFN